MKKKVSMWFIVDEEVLDEVENHLFWGEMGSAATILNEKCEESDYNFEDYNEEEEML